MQHPPPAVGEDVRSDFLCELGSLADRNTIGPGISHSSIGTAISLPQDIPDDVLYAFELSDSLEPGGYATGWTLDWDSDAEEYTQPDYESDTNVTVYDVEGYMRAAGKDDVATGERGAIGFCLANGVIVSIQQLARRCKALLAANVAMGDGTTTVNVDNVVPDDGGQSPVGDSSETITVRNRPRYSALDNAPCDIMWDEAAGEWVLEWVWQRAKLIRGTLGGALTTTTASQTVSSPVACDAGQLPSGTITLYNVFVTKGFVGPSGGSVVAMWNETSGHYEIIDCECP